jgi:hypothetical protein
LEAHEKTAHVGCDIRPRLRRIIDGLPKTGRYVHDDAFHKRARDARHERAVTRSAPGIFAACRISFRCGTRFLFFCAKARRPIGPGFFSNWKLN